MRYEVTLRGPRGASETVHVEADSGDDAAGKAFKPYHIVTSVQPAQLVLVGDDGCPASAVDEPMKAIFDSIKAAAINQTTSPPRKPRAKKAS